MFAVKEMNNWVAINLKEGSFYIISEIPGLSPYDTIEIINDIEGECDEHLLKKYNFLNFAGCKNIKIISGKKKIFGIIDYTHKIQYGKDDKNRFITIFRPLSFNFNPFIIKTKNRLNYNVYAIAEQTDEKFNEYSVLKCLEVLGQVSTLALDIMSPFHALDCIPKKWRKTIPSKLPQYDEIIDLTSKNVFSIDGDTTVDVDDALHYDFQDNKHIIGIHIADVANLVLSLGIDQTEFLNLMIQNTSSIYPGSLGKVDMISKEVGEDICSLIEGKERNVISLLLEFQQEKPFKLISAKIHLSKIINKNKLTYKNVDKMLSGKSSRKDISTDIFQIKTIIEGQTNFPQTNESQVEEQYQDEKISRTIVAKLMTIYNSFLAKKLYDTHKKSILRVHYGCSSTIEDENEEIREILQRLETFKGYYRVSEEVPRDELQHQGLSLTYYTHASSPIRRFVDLWNQICLYETLFPGLNTTGAINIREKINEINWKQSQIKRAYDQLSLVNIYHDKINGTLPDSFEGWVIGIDEDYLQIYLNKKIFHFQVDMENMDTVLELVSQTDEEKIWKRKDNGSRFCLRKGMKIICKIIVKKNKYQWNQKVGIELINPSFSEFLLK